MTDTVNTVERKQPLYRNKYVLELDEDDEDTNTATPNGEPSNNEPTPEPAPVSPEENSYKKRYDSLKTHYDKTVNELRAQINGLNTQLKKTTEQFNLPTSTEDLEEWRKEFPDLYKIVRMIARLEADERTKELDTKLQEVEVDKKKATREKAEAVLLRLHPDFPELKDKKEFREWLDEQHPHIQAWLYDNTDDPYLAAKAVDMYKLEVGIKKQKQPAKNTNVDASLVVGKGGKGEPEGTPAKQWRLSEIQKLTPAQYEKQEAEIDKAIAEGRVIYDM